MFRFPRITSSLLSVPSYVGSLRQKSQQHRTAPKVFFVPKTIKRADGAITEKLVQCTCNNANDFKALRKQVGELVGPQGNLVQNFNDVVNDAVYDVTLDSAALQSSVVNLIGTSNSFARSAELQVLFSCCLSNLLRFLSPSVLIGADFHCRWCTLCVRACLALEALPSTTKPSKWPRWKRSLIIFQ